MDEQMKSQQGQNVEQETQSGEHHAQWALEKDTEGLDKNEQSFSSGSEDESQGQESEDSSSGCGCKYF